MAVELEWHFKDEVSESGPQDQEERRPRRPRRRDWLRLGGAVLLLVGVGLYAWWRVRREALAAAEAEVRSVAQLEVRALAEGDAELYLSLQDQADPGWQRAQQTRAARDAVLPPPLPSLTATAVLSVADARVVGDVARVETVRVAGPPGGEMAPFRATRFYRRSEDGRWLHTGVDLDFAGHTVVLAGRRVVITSFAADAEQMRSVAARLEGMGDRFCGLASCRGRPPVGLVFTDTLGTASEPEGVLPAPFLVGAPDGEAARATWEAGVRELLLDRLIAREMDGSVSSAEGEPHTGVLFRARLREWLRAKLSLREPISPDLGLVGQALDAGQWIDLGTLWYMQPTDDDSRRRLAEAQVDVFLAFIEREYGPATVVSLLPELREARWIGTMVEETLDQDWLSFEHRYAAYALEAIDRSVEFPGEVSAFAGYDLVAACGWPSNLWGLRLDQPEMTLLSRTGSFDHLSWSDDGGRLLAWHSGIDSRALYLLESDGSGVRPLTGVLAEAIPADWSPDGSQVAFSAFGQSPAGGLVEVETGEITALDGHVLAWSPDGSHLAYVASMPGPPRVWLSQGNGSNPRQVGGGDQIAWSPDGTQIAFSGMYEASLLKVYDVTTEETTNVLDWSALYDLLGIAAERSFAAVNSLAWSPTGEWIGLGVGQVDGMESVSVQGGIVLVRPDGSDLHAPFTRQAGAAVTAWSPDGRWLTGRIYDQAEFTTVVIGMDGTILAETGAAVAWSPDGRYLAAGEMEGLRVLEIESGTWYSFEPPARCGAIAWNPRGPLYEPAPGMQHTARHRPLGLVWITTAFRDVSTDSLHVSA